MGNISKSSNISFEYENSSCNLYVSFHCNSCFSNLCYQSYQKNNKKSLKKTLKKYPSKCQCQEKLKKYVTSPKGIEQYKDFMNILNIYYLIEKEERIKYSEKEFSEKYWEIINRKSANQYLKRILNQKIIFYEDKYKQPFLNKIY